MIFFILTIFIVLSVEMFAATHRAVGGYTLRSDFKFNGVNVSFSDMIVVATPY